MIKRSIFTSDGSKEPMLRCVSATYRRWLTKMSPANLEGVEVAGLIFTLTVSYIATRAGGNATKRSQLK